MSVHCLPEITAQHSPEDLLKLMSRALNQGTAFALTPDRFVTCYHVIKNLDPKQLKLSGAPDYTANLPWNFQNVLEIERDPELDIALLKTERVQGDIVPIALQHGVPQVGLDILAVGYPLPKQKSPEIIESEKRINVDVALTFRALRGIIAARTADGSHFEIDKHVDPGQSGGPVVSIENGKLLGMC
jgi:S1-C subfamily serine protease